MSTEGKHISSCTFGDPTGEVGNFGVNARISWTGATVTPGNNANKEAIINKRAATVTLKNSYNFI